MTHPPQTDAQFVAEMAQRPIELLKAYSDGSGLWGTIVEHADLQRLVLLAAQPTWQPMETAPLDRNVRWWIVPKEADETYLDGAGRPITVAHEPYFDDGRYGQWGALSKAVAWTEIPVVRPPFRPAPPEETDQ